MLKTQLSHQLEQPKAYSDVAPVKINKCKVKLPKCITVKNAVPLKVQKEFQVKIPTGKCSDSQNDSNNRAPSPTELYEFPPLSFTSIVFDTRQGDLLRKRQELYDHFYDPKPDQQSMNKQISLISSIDESVDIDTIYLETNPQQLSNWWSFLAQFITKNSKPKHWMVTIINQSDSEFNNCHGCSTPFTFFNRRHHCRLCGLIFCNTCTMKRAVCLGHDGPQRICQRCFDAEVLN